LSGKASKKNKKDEYWLIGNPLRRRILEIIAERGAITPSELRRELNISFGTLYYHLNLMKNYLERNSNKELKLSPEGWRALSYVSELEVLRKFKLTSLVTIFETGKRTTLRAALATLTIASYIAADHLYGLKTSLMISFFESRQSPIHLSALHVLGNWLTLTLIMLVLTIILTRRKLSLAEITNTLIGVAASTSPCLLYLWSAILDSSFSQYVFVASQALTCMMIISMLIGTLKIGSEKAAIITLLTMYSALLALEAVATFLI